MSKSPNASTRTAAQRILEWLTARGYRAYLDRDGDVRFTVGTSSYAAAFDEKDPVFFRLVLADFWEIDTESERLHALAAAVAATAETKVAKIYLVDRSVWASVELFYDPPEQVVRVLERAMDALHAAVYLFVNIMQGHRLPQA